MSDSDYLPPSEREAELWARLESATGSDRADVLLELSGLRNLVDDLVSAMSLADEALQVAQDLESESLIALAHAGRGVVLYNRGDYLEAAKAHNQAIEIVRNTSDLPQLYHSLVCATDAYSQAEAPELALEMAEAGVECATELEDDARLLLALVRKADLLEELGRDDEILEVVSQARQAAR